MNASFSKLFVTLFLLIVSTITNAQKFSTAGFYPIKNSPRKVFNFNPGWRFFKGDVKRAELETFDDHTWEAANIPHGLEIVEKNASGGRNYQGIAWYRKQFHITDTSKKNYLYFEAIMGKCIVWVNGKKLKEHFGGYLPFAVDITGVVKNGKNIVAVKTDNSNDTTYLPGKAQSGLDFTYMGGIYRDTYLIQTSHIHVSFTELSTQVAGGGVFVGTLDVNKNNANIEVRTALQNESSQKNTIILVTTIEDAQHHVLKTTKKQYTVKPKHTKQVRDKINVTNIKLWHPDTPHLNFVKTELFVNNQLIDAMRTRVGIRLYEMKGEKGLYINKQPYKTKLIGVNKHQDYTYIGNALPNSGQWRDVKLLREGGSKIIRVGHYPQDPAFYDACDELGMLTTTANPGWHFFNFKNPIFEKRLYNDTRELVRRDRNVASILMWETALNETPAQPANAMNTMHKIAHKEYPFPGMFTVTDYQEAEKGGLDLHYHGINPAINSFNREYGDGGEVDNWKSQNATTRVNIEWGEQALLNQALIQAATLNNRYNTPTSRLGGALWAGIDHQRGYHPDPFWGGLLSGVRVPKYVYYLYKSQYNATYKVKGIETGPMIFIAHELTQISPKDLVFFSNCDALNITWLGKDLGTIYPSKEEQYKHLPHAPFILKNVFDFSIINTDWRKKTNQIELVVKGMIDGKVVLTKTKNYAERTSGLKLSMDGQGLPLKADGSDIIPIRATVVDTDGVKKVLASEEVYFELKGDASLIGTNPVKTEMGIATILVKAGMQPSDITIKAYCKGLNADTIHLKSRKCDDLFLYDDAYLKTSVTPKKNNVITIKTNTTNLSTDVLKLHQEINDLKLIITGKEQELMEFRNRKKAN